MADDLDILKTGSILEGDTGLLPKDSSLFPKGSLSGETKSEPKITLAKTFSRTCPKCGFNGVLPGQYNGERDKMLRCCAQCGVKWEEDPLDKTSQNSSGGLGGERVLNQIIAGLKKIWEWWKNRK